MVRATPLRHPIHGRRRLGRAGVLGRSRIGAEGQGDAMIIPYEAMTVVSRHAYPNGHPMYVVQFSVPAAPLKRARVKTRIFGAAYSGPIIGYNPTQGTCEAQLFHQEAAP